MRWGNGIGLVLAAAIFAGPVRSATSSASAPSLPELQSVPRSSDYYAWALLEGARVYYRQQAWPAFFGLAAHARAVLPLERPRFTITALEVLALYRHCQWKAADALARDLTRTAGDRFPLAHALVGWMELLPLAPRGKLANSGVILPTFSEWPVNGLAWQQLDPWKLRRHVESLCTPSDLEEGHD